MPLSLNTAVLLCGSLLALMCGCVTGPPQRAQVSSDDSARPSHPVELPESSSERASRVGDLIRRGENEEAMTLLREKPDLFPGEGWGLSPLDMAVAWGNLQMVKFLIHDLGVYYDRYVPLLNLSGVGLSEVGLALSNGHIEVAHYLIEQGADPNLGRCVLLPGGARMMTRYSHFEELESQREEYAWMMLLEAGLNPFVRDRDTNESLLHAAHYPASPNIVRFLLKCGLDPNARDLKGRTPLHYACAHPFKRVSSGEPGGMQNVFDLAVVRALLEGGADLNARSKLGWTPVQTALMGRINYPSHMDEFVALLRKYGATEASISSQE